MIISGAIVAKAIWTWVLKHWKDLLIGLAVIGVAAFISSWYMRGAKVERQKEENITLELKLKNAKEDHKQKLEACGEKIDEIEKTHADAIRKANARASRLESDLAVVTVEADRARAEHLRTRRDVATSINRAETAEEKIDVFLQAMQERIDAN